MFKLKFYSQFITRIKSLNPIVILLVIIISFIGLTIFCSILYKTRLDINICKNTTITSTLNIEKASNNTWFKLKPEETKTSTTTTTERTIFSDELLTISDCGYYDRHNSSTLKLFLINFHFL
jgi:hypothetical protein